jgi:hypothetical protein
MSAPPAHNCHYCTFSTQSVSPVFSVCRDDRHFQTSAKLQTNPHARSDSSNGAEFTAVPAGKNFLSCRCFVNFCWLSNGSFSNYVIFSWRFALPLDTGHAPTDRQRVSPEYSWTPCTVACDTSVRTSHGTQFASITEITSEWWLGTKWLFMWQPSTTCQNKILGESWDIFRSYKGSSHWRHNISGVQHRRHCYKQQCLAG